MKFLSWTPDLYFQQCTKHLCQEAILLSLAPSCQNIQNWNPCSPHSLLWPVSQLSLTILPSASLPGQTSSLSGFQSLLQKLQIRSCYSLLNSVIPDHLQNYVQTSFSRWNSKCRGVWPLPIHQIPPFFPPSDPSFKHCASILNFSNMLIPKCHSFTYPVWISPPLWILSWTLLPVSVLITYILHTFVTSCITVLVIIFHICLCDRFEVLGGRESVINC